MNEVLISNCHSAQAFIHSVTEGSDENVIIQSNLLSNVQFIITRHISEPSLHHNQKENYMF